MQLVDRRFHPRGAEALAEQNERESTLAMERQRGIVHVIVDAPELAIVRLHGRNAQTWSGADSAADRFNQAYSEDDLRALAPEIEAVAKNVGRTHVLSITAIGMSLGATWE
ncbi:uncharacterized protein YecE (DUF72 family) [Paraburkholderia sp. CI2]|uniref:DUF72 domain-containing protein n=1 Tax=Paraburkholderia sp. CI2 TaxID=2723093 RepID=UPI0017D3979A|nr:DUF72 domain-containing protein [Paraburkholderia sp. CI2]MBB5469251.1 uncharacterized protein YecE (DUF72 family) [Paraburkholderia sp. CI2]